MSLAFVVARCPLQSRGAAKMTVTGLRSLLGFLHLRGLIAGPLAGAVPSTASWRLSGLPRALEPEQLQALLGSCDRETATGRRDYGVLAMLARLGLRAGEVAALSLDDVDWRAGELVIVGKGRRSERLPLPTMSARRSSTTCGPGGPRQRRTGGCSCVSSAPHHGLTTGGVTQVVCRCAPRRAGPDPRAPAAAHRRDGDAQGRREPGGDRAGTAPPAGADHGDLRQGRPRRAAAARAAVAGGRS